MRTKLLTWFGVALSLVLVWWIATRFDLMEAARAVKLAEPGWLIAGGLVYALLFTLRGARWAVLLRHLKPVSARTTTEVFAVGFMANNILPARLGDVARAYILARRERMAAAGTFASVMLERIFDGLTVVAFLNAVLWLEPPDADWVGPFALLTTAIFVAAIFVCTVVALSQTLATSMVSKTLFWLPSGLLNKIYGLVVRLGTGLHALRSPRQTAEVVVLSLLIWTIEVSVYVLVARAYSLDVPLSGMVLVMCVLTLGLAVPSAPGFVGVFEGLVIKAVGAYGIGGPMALAFAVSVHLIHYIPGTLLGLVFAWQSGLRLTELKAAAGGSSNPAGEAAAATPAAPEAAETR